MGADRKIIPCIDWSRARHHFVGMTYTRGGYEPARLRAYIAVGDSLILLSSRPVPSTTMAGDVHSDLLVLDRRMPGTDTAFRDSHVSFSIARPCAARASKQG